MAMCLPPGKLSLFKCATMWTEYGIPKKDNKTGIMTIEIHHPALESLIQQRMKSGAFRSVEDVLIHALTIASASEANDEPTGASLIAAMQFVL
jgi:hypothetical protein